MRRALAVFVCAASPAFAVLPVYEGFPYDPGPLLGQSNATSGTSWLLAAQSPTTSTDAINVVSDSLTPPPGLAAAAGNSLKITGIGNLSGAANRLAFATTGEPITPVTSATLALWGADHPPVVEPERPRSRVY